MSSRCLHLITDEAALAGSMLCPLLSQGKSNSVFPASSGAGRGLCKGFTDERGNHFLMHAKVIIGGICATGKNLDFSSSLMRKLRSSVAKYLLGESRGSRGVYSLKEMGGLSGCSSDIIRARGMHGAVLGLILLPWWSRKLSSLSPPSCWCPRYTEPQGGHEPCRIFYFNFCFKDHVFFCVCVCVRERLASHPCPLQPS